MATATAVAATLVPEGARRILISGDEKYTPALLRTVTDELCGALGVEQRHFAVEHVTADGVADAIWVASSPSLLGARILIVDDAAAADRDQLVALLSSEQVDDVAVVAVWAGGRVPKAVSAVDGIHTLSQSEPRNARDRAAFIAEQVEAAGLILDRATMSALCARLGENTERIWSVIEVMAAHVNDDGRVDASALDMIAGGGAPPWALSDAIESGDAVAAIRAAHTLMGASKWEPLGVVGYLRKRYLAVWRVAQGTPPVAGFPGKAHARVARRWGPDGAEGALELIDGADGDLKGASRAPAAGIIEVLVARLARLGR